RKQGVRSGFATPLIDRSGLALGAIAAGFREQHRPSTRQIRLVELYARQAADFLQNARLHERLLEADRRKDEFLALLSHELRNPPSSILTAARLAREPNSAPADPGESLRVIEHEARTIARHVDDLLETARINAGKLVLRTERVPVAEVMRRSLETERPTLVAA